MLLMSYDLPQFIVTYHKKEFYSCNGMKLKVFDLFLTFSDLLCSLFREFGVICTLYSVNSFNAVFSAFSTSSLSSGGTSSYLQTLPSPSTTYLCLLHLADGSKSAIFLGELAKCSVIYLISGIIR